MTSIAILARPTHMWTQPSREFPSEVVYANGDAWGVSDAGDTGYVASSSAAGRRHITSFMLLRQYARWFSRTHVRYVRARTSSRGDKGSSMTFWELI